MTQHFIDNRPVPGASGESITVMDPSTGQPYDRIARGNAADIDRARYGPRGAPATPAPGAGSPRPSAAA